MVMPLEDGYIALLKRLPGVAEPIKRLTFKDKLKWTGIILILYYFMSQISIYGASKSGYEYFQYLQMLMGSKFGSLVTLGIGPIVTASIILQLLVGSKIIPWNLKEDRGRTLFQGTQKLAALVLCVIEAWAYVAFGAIPIASPELLWIVVFQMALGGWLVIFMDELISKWGFGSGVGLFIVAGVSSQMITMAFNPIAADAAMPIGVNNLPSGILPSVAVLMGNGEPMAAFLRLLPILATIIVFMIVVYVQAIRVEIPLAFSTVRGFGRRWPLKFLYTSNIPVILMAALLANVQVFARLIAQNGGNAWLGTFDASGNPTGGLIMFLLAPRSEAIAGLMIFIGLFALLAAFMLYFTKIKAGAAGGFKLVAVLGAIGGALWFAFAYYSGLSALAVISMTDIARLISYTVFLGGGSIIFSVFWVSTAGMDAGSVASQIESTGMQIPGYRRDIRIIERVLNKYIPTLAILGGASVGLLAAYADFTYALGTGTGILLAVTIVYQLYEEIAYKHMEDMHPAMRRFFGK
jgi:preprotein translocase subunit SecY